METGALPVAQRLQLLDIMRNSLEPVQTEAAPTKAFGHLCILEQ